MRVKLLLGALLVCGLLAIPVSAEAGCFGGLFRGGGCNILSSLRSARSHRMGLRAARHNARMTRIDERSVLIIDGKRPCAAGKCDIEAPPEVSLDPDTNDGALLEVHPRGALSDIVQLDIDVLGSGSLLDLNHIPSPGSIWSGLNLAGRPR